LKACALSLGVQQVRSLWKGAPVGPMRDQCHLRTYQRQCAPEVALDSPGVLLRGLSARLGRLRPAWTRTVLAPGCKGPSCPAQCVGTGPFMVLNGRTVVSAAGDPYEKGEGVDVDITALQLLARPDKELP